MARTHTFKGSEGLTGYGYYAYIEDGQLVIGGDWGREGGILYKGPYAHVDNHTMRMLENNAPKLYKSIIEYYNNVNIESKKSATISSPTKLCEIKVDRKDSLQELIYHLTANGYGVQTAVVWKEFPNTGIDYWMIAIFEQEDKDETLD